MTEAPPGIARIAFRRFRLMVAVDCCWGQSTEQVGELAALFGQFARTRAGSSRPTTAQLSVWWMSGQQFGTFGDEKPATATVTVLPVALKADAWYCAGTPINVCARWGACVLVAWSYTRKGAATVVGGPTSSLVQPRPSSGRGPDSLDDVIFGRHGRSPSRWLIPARRTPDGLAAANELPRLSNVGRYQRLWGHRAWRCRSRTGTDAWPARTVDEVLLLIAPPGYGRAMSSPWSTTKMASGLPAQSRQA
jgi:hypothetical protein